MEGVTTKEDKTAVWGAEEDDDEEDSEAGSFSEDVSEISIPDITVEKFEIQMFNVFDQARIWLGETRKFTGSAKVSGSALRRKNARLR